MKIKRFAYLALVIIVMFAITTPAMAETVCPCGCGAIGCRCLVRTVDIDIKPESSTNSINLASNGVIPIAILGSADFDVHDIDALSLLLEGTAVTTKGKSGKAGSYDDANGDGILDLVVHFVVSSFNQGQTEATLTGSLLDGTAIEGTDSIHLIPPE